MKYGHFPLTKEELRGARAEAHHLKPELFIGKEGLSDYFLDALFEAFNTKELLKIKIQQNSPDDVMAVMMKLEALTNIQIVDVIGKTFILYRPKEEDESKSKPA